MTCFSPYRGISVVVGGGWAWLRWGGDAIDRSVNGAAHRSLGGVVGMLEEVLRLRWAPVAAVCDGVVGVVVVGCGGGWWLYGEGGG